MRRTIPIIRLAHVLIVSIQIELRDDLVLELRDDLANEMRRNDVEGLVLEVSGIELIDSYIARAIRDISQLGRLMGVRTVLVGLDPAMATTLVEMGTVLRDVQTKLDLATALASFGMTMARPLREVPEGLHGPEEGSHGGLHY